MVGTDLQGQDLGIAIASELVYSTCKMVGTDLQGQDLGIAIASELVYSTC